MPFVVMAGFRVNDETEAGVLCAKVEVLMAKIDGSRARYLETPA